MTFARLCAAACAVLFALPITAQTSPPPAIDLKAVQAVIGTWIYRPMVGGSDADFVDGSGHLRLSVRCLKATRVVSIIQSEMMTAAPTLVVTTSYGTRSLPARFTAASIAADVSANDPLLDEIAFSRGKWAIANSGNGALVLPSWAEPARVIEDCRS